MQKGIIPMSFFKDHYEVVIIGGALSGV